MTFKLGSERKEEAFSIFYREDEYSFDVNPIQEPGYTTILIKNMQLEISDKGEILYLWGLCPLFNCLQVNHYPKNYIRHRLEVLLDDEMVPGISFRLESSDEWSVSVNEEAKWICVGDTSLEGIELVEFMPGCVASLEKGTIKAIWVHLEKLPEFEILET